jgi:hypothetical protein
MARLERNGFQVFCVESEGTWLYDVLPAVLSVDKPVIRADGADTAVATAEVPVGTTEITFYHSDTDDVITTVPVDPVTHTATFQITATTPGAIRIRAGEPTRTRLNEVVINAS